MSREERDAVRAWLDLLTVSSAIKKEVDSKFRKEFGHSISRFDVFSALHRGGPEGLRASELSQFLLVTDGATTQITAPLVREGLVRREPCPDDRRSAFFALTQQGSDLFAEMAEFHRALILSYFRGFSPEELQELRTLVRQVDLPILRRTERRTAA